MKRRNLFAAPLTALVLVFSLLPVAYAQGRPNQPVITGTKASSMDAPESDEQLESYAHSSSVKYLARKAGISTPEMARLIEDFNSGVLIAVILYYLLKIVPGKFREKRETLARELVEAQKATADAEDRMKRVEARLQSLGGEMNELRQQAAEMAKGEEARMHASMEAERARIVHSAEKEIEAAQAAAERELRRYASNLAVDRATERVRLSPEGDQMLVDEFLQGLAGQLSKEQN